MTRPRETAPPWLIPAMVFAAATTALALYAFLHFGHRYDFMIFFQDGRAWNQGEPLYKYENMNPPTLTIAIFAPLARLGFNLARAVWLAVGGLGILLSMRAIIREAGLSHHRAIAMIVLFLATHGTYVAITQGQVTFWLLWPVTRAWIAVRHGRHAIGGLWLGPVIAIKPTIALTALLLPWPVWVVAGALSAAITGLGILAAGWGPWAQWLEAGADVDWITQHLNASLWSLAARWEIGQALHVRLRDLSMPVILLVVAVGLLLGWRARRTKDIDRRFTLALLWHALMSPLGWIYYLPLAVGPAAATWRSNRWAIAAFLLSFVPLGFVSVHVAWSAPIVRTMGSIYPAAILCAWVAWSRSEANARLEGAS